MEIEIREVYGEWALDIEMPDRIQVIYFTSRQNALQVMHYLQLVDNIIELDKKKLQTPMTNYDRIKAMSVEEMSDFLMDWVTEALTNPKCIVVKNWLESEVSE